MAFLDSTGLAYFWEKIKALFGKSASLERGENIPDNSDLDTYLTIGNYYVERAAQAATIAHTPTTDSGYVLKVLEASPANGYRIQMAITNDSGYIYKRYYNISTGFSDWQEYVPEADVERQVLNESVSVSNTTHTVPVNYNFKVSVFAMYIISCGRLNTNTDTNTGLYIVKSYKSTSTYTNVSAIKSASGVTISCDGTDITITTTVTNMRFSVLQVV